MRGVKLIIPAIVLIAVVVFQSLFIVQEISQAIVLQFGDPKKIITKAGLNFKLPFIQNVVYLDKRILNLDNEPEEVIAADQKRLIVDAFARFKIVDPLKFYISVGNERVARSRLSTIINSRIRGVLGTQELATLLSTDRARQMQIIQSQVNQEAQNFGIEIVDVRIKRADLPPANSEAIYKRMQTEREREAKEFRAQGAEIAQKIRSTADKDVTVILAEANDLDFWTKLNEKTVEVIILAMPKHHSNIEAAKQIKNLNLDCQIYAVARFDEEVEELQSLGVTAFHIYTEAGVGLARQTYKT